MNPERVREVVGRALADLNEAGLQFAVVIAGYGKGEYHIDSMPHEVVNYGAYRHLGIFIGDIEEEMDEVQEGADDDDADEGG